MNANPYSYSPKQQTEECVRDCSNPFGNSTEFQDYSPDYRSIVPQTAMKNCELPETPATAEKRKIKHYYNMTGLFMTGQILIVNILAFIISMAVSATIAAIDGSAALNDGYYDIIMQKFSNSSINMALNGICYMTANILVFMIGCKATGIDRSSFFKTRDIDAKTMMRYVVIAIFLQMASAMLSNAVVSPLLDNIFGVDIYASLEDSPVTSSVTKTIVTVLYTCIIAPVTEELVLRGFVLKNLSRVSQRFGIITSALIFALMHENIPQFILAFTVGIFLGYVAVKHNSIIPAIILHMTVNTTNTVISLIAEMNEDIGNIIYTVWVLFFLIFGAVIFIISIIKNKDKFPKPVQAQKNRCVPLMFQSVGMDILILTHIVLTFTYLVMQ